MTSPRLTTLPPCGWLSHRLLGEIENVLDPKEEKLSLNENIRASMAVRIPTRQIMPT